MYVMTSMGMVAPPGNCVLVTVQNSFTQRIGSETLQASRDLW